MFVAIDIGNSTTVCAVVENDNHIIERRVIKNSESWTVKKICWSIEEFFRSPLIENRQREEMVVGVSSVVPERSKIVREQLREAFGVEVFFIDITLIDWITFQYDNPEMLGADRICDVIAAAEFYSPPFIVVDFGTATTFNVVDKNRHFIGGVISPGIEVLQKSLHNSTAALPEFELSFPQKLIASNTIDALNVGLLRFSLFGWQRLIEGIIDELGSQAQVIVTGGLSPFIIERSRIHFQHEPDLLLKGIKIFHRRAILHKNM